MISSNNKFSLFRKIRFFLSKFRTPNESIDEAVDKRFRFSSSLSLDAPNGQIESIKKDDETGVYHLSVYDNGLTGANGVLPIAYTEWLIERKMRYNDMTAKAFLDMFDHRIYCLSYLAWQKMHLFGDGNRQEDNVLRNVILSLTGITPCTLGLIGLAYTSFYAPSVRSLSGLEQLLSSLYQLSVTVQPFRKKNENVEPQEQAKLGFCQYTLGDGLVIGSVRLVVDSHFDVILGPVDYERALKFMSGGPFHRRIREQILSYTGVTPEFDVRILIQSGENDNKLTSDKKLGFNISIGLGNNNLSSRCFCITD